jgi:DNA-binding response OmpR family regulator
VQLGVPESGRPVLLLAEDEPTLAILLTDQLQLMGYRVAGPFANCATALAWLASNTPDSAILDLHPGDAPCSKVAIELCRRNIPFVVLSGGEDLPDPMREVIQGAPILEKPANLESILEALAKL